MTRKLILSLDIGDPAEARKVLKECGEYIDLVKVGSQLFLLGGTEVVRKIQDMGKEVFLDLKFHDIPSTVAQAACRSVDLGVMMFNVHTLGGSAMMKTVVNETREYSRRRGKRLPIILGVTVLTSVDQKTLREDFHCQRPIPELVVSLARLAQKAGVDGSICSPGEIRAIKEACGRNFIVVVPGIRPAKGMKKHDQKRTATPGEAIRAGADFIVVGRSILEAKDRRKALEDITEEIQNSEVPGG